MATHRTGHGVLILTCASLMLCGCDESDPLEVRTRLTAALTIPELRAATLEAKETGRSILVLLEPRLPASDLVIGPPGTSASLLDLPARRALSAQYVVLAPRDGTGVDSALRGRLGVGDDEFRLVVLGLSGAVLDRFAPPDADELRLKAAGYKAEHREFLQEIRRLRGIGSSGRLGLARLLLKHSLYEEVCQLLGRDLSEGLEAPEPSMLLSSAYRGLGMHVREHSVLQKLVASFPEHADRVHWRVRLATMSRPPRLVPGMDYWPPEALRALREELDKQRDAYGAALVRQTLISGYSTSPGDYLRMLEEIIELVPNTPLEAESRLQVSVVYYNMKDDCERAIEHLVSFLKAHPEHPAAPTVRDVTLPNLRREASKRK